MARYQAWMKKLAKKGWIAAAWPTEYGGAGMTIMQQFIFNEELALARAPRPGGIGIAMAGPTIIVTAPRSRRRSISPACSQATSSGAGLLRTGVWFRPGLSAHVRREGRRRLRHQRPEDLDHRRPVRPSHDPPRADGPAGPQAQGHLILPAGHELSRRQRAPPRKHGGYARFNEVFFDNVRIPKNDLLGEENRGWYVGTTTLDFERSSIGTSIAQTNAVEDLLVWVKDRRGAVQPTVRLELAERAIEAEAARLMSYRVITMQNRGMVPNHESSAVKIYAAELNQRITGTAMKVAGLFGQLNWTSKAADGSAVQRWTPNRGRFVRGYLGAVASTIAGGTSEINRNIIASRGLGLPRD